MKRAFMIIIAAGMAMSLSAQRMTMDECMAYAVEHSISVGKQKNAVEACCRNEGDCKVEVRAYLNSDERVHIDVCNNGCAIPREIEEDIFTPFFTTKREGSGVGLAVSKQIIRLHGGMLYLSHNSDGKVVFSILLE
jgi:C4-dicarboxylate-specific signal transduction histidine kinase